MSIIDSFFSLIKRGREGRNIGISTGLKKLDKVIYGLQKKYLYLVGGDSGSGKSSLTMYMFIYRPIRDAQLNGKQMKMLFFSFEMAAEVLYAKLLSMYIYETYGRVISYSDILSLSKTLSKEDFDLIVQCKSWLQEIEQHLTIIDSPVPPRGLYKITMDWLEQFGTWEKEKDANVRFIPNDPDMFLLGVVDHIRLLSNSSESNGVKGKIDEACDYMISLRNRTAMSWVVVQQLNRNFKSADRRNSEYNLLQLDDKDSFMMSSLNWDKRRKP